MGNRRILVGIEGDKSAKIIVRRELGFKPKIVNYLAASSDVSRWCPISRFGKTWVPFIFVAFVSGGVSIAFDFFLANNLNFVLVFVFYARLRERSKMSAAASKQEL